TVDRPALPRFAVHLLASLPLALAGTAQAASYLVTGEGDVATGRATHCDGTAPNFFCPTLRDAIAAANATPDDDSIGFHPLYAQSFTLTHGALAITDNGSLTIDGDTASGTNTPISGNNASRVFVIEA